MFTEYHVIQFILHSLITKPKDGSSQTIECKVSFVFEQYQTTNCLKSTL